MPVNDIDRQTMGCTELQEINRLSEFIMNLMKVILSVNLIMCDIESLTTETRESMNAFKNEVESEKGSVCCFINPYCFLLSLIISFLFRDNPVTSVAVNSSLCQL